MRGVNLELIERLKDERARNLQQRAADYLATEPDQLSQRLCEAQISYMNERYGYLHDRILKWRGQSVHVYYECQYESLGNGRSLPCYSIEAIYDAEWMDVADQVTNSELDDLERQLFNLDNLARCGL